MFYNKAKKTAVARLKNAEKVYNNLSKEANDTAIELYQIRKSASQGSPVNADSFSFHASEPCHLPFCKLMDGGGKSCTHLLV